MTPSDTNFLFASLVWGSIGAGYWLYGKKQRSMPAMAGGGALLVASYVMESALLLSVVSIAIMVGVYYWSKHEG